MTSETVNHTGNLGWSHFYAKRKIFEFTNSIGVIRHIELLLLYRLYSIWCDLVHTENENLVSSSYHKLIYSC